jgi:branched-subunit amino acid transport protein
VTAATAWAVVGLCAVVTAAIKAIGPVALGGRELPAWFRAFVAMLAPALLSALVVTNALADGDHLAVGADSAGVAAAGVVMWRGGSILLGVTIAAVVTAALRAFGA